MQTIADDRFTLTARDRGLRVETVVEVLQRELRCSARGRAGAGLWGAHRRVNGTAVSGGLY